MSKTRWLDALSDGTAGLKTISSCMSVCDLKNDNYYKLIAAEISFDLEIKPRLRVYKGTQVVHDQNLPGIPSAVESLYIDETHPKMPIVAVSVGPSILFYRNMKPYFKYTVPSLIIEPLEMEIWKKLVSDRSDNYQKHIDDLKSINTSELSTLSQQLITLNDDEREFFIRDNMEPKLERLPTIVAMTKIYKSIEEEKSSNCLIIATESSDILIMDVQSFNILHQARVCNFKATPDLLSASGSFQNDFKIVIATREGSLCILRKNWLEGREIVKLENPATAMCLLQIDQTIVVLNTVLAMTFGKLGLEDHVLVLVTNNGSLLIKILKRTAEFSEPLSVESKTTEDSTNMTVAIPKKTKIFIEQTIREKENASAIHNIFQSELWRMRLEAAKTTIDILRTGDSTFSGDYQTPLKLLAQVDGLGPDFLLTVTLENISATKIAGNLSILLHADPEHYKIKRRYADLSPLMPGIPLEMDFQVSVALTPDNLLPSDMTTENSIIRVLIIKENLSKPLIASTVVMPQPELQLLIT
ncbi:CLUMA_CG008608, isoform A [Clunio marinus]|uniref:CLUMA_CG008608, isoform A n=1 Tax=Clunio marinus TaxID=568069 RepID=A0A1J1I5W4_9DIPT|nr:CLUMA_CG008608, isoform A [Clunio marinus]